MMILPCTKAWRKSDLWSRADLLQTGNKEHTPQPNPCPSVLWNLQSP
jgi:hypothetical protein